MGTNVFIEEIENHAGAFSLALVGRARVGVDRTIASMPWVTHPQHEDGFGRALIGLGRPLRAGRW